MNTIIRTVIVDDSAFVRKVVKEMLSGSPYIDVVGMARNGEEALSMVAEFKHDVVTCDLSMPVMGGVGFVRKQMARQSVPILILSSSPEDGDEVMEALNAGAVDFVRKPNAFASEELWNVREELIEKVKVASKAPIGQLRKAHPPAKAAALGPQNLKIDAVVLGISTGGPQALRHLLPQLPTSFPVPLAIVLHMPLGYTAMFAERLNEMSSVEVREAKHGDIMTPGLVLLGKAGRHLTFSRGPTGQVTTKLTCEPMDKLHRPSVDVLFQSAAETYDSRLLGIVMSGMGDDGKQGCAWIKSRGGRVLTEAEKSCVIYGMPRSVVEAGLSDEVVPLGSMADAIMRNL
jgi:two-component system chemotaxis response regulator CheB